MHESYSILTYQNPYFENTMTIFCNNDRQLKLYVLLVWKESILDLEAKCDGSYLTIKAMKISMNIFTCETLHISDAHESYASNLS